MQRKGEINDGARLTLGRKTGWKTDVVKERYRDTSRMLMIICGTKLIVSYLAEINSTDGVELRTLLIINTEWTEW